MRELSALEQQARRELERRLIIKERSVSQIFRSALDEVRGRMQSIYDKYAINGKLTLAQMTKYNRYASMEKQMLKIVTPALRTGVRQINRLLPEVYQESFFRHAWAVDNSTGLRLNWGVLNPETIAANIANPWLTIAEERLVLNGKILIRSALNQELALGKSYDSMAGDLAEALNRTNYEALQILRTEGQSAINAAQNDAYERAQEEGVEGNVVWSATLDGDTRDTHQDMDGQKKGKDGFYDGPGDEKALYPGWSGLSAGERINCFPGETMVSCLGLEKAYKRWYEGELFTIETSGGINLSATPNHPILTDNGWVPISKLKHGDNVVSVSGLYNFVPGGPYKNCKPSMISKVFKFLNIVGSRERIMDRGMNFHGDGKNSNVNIISINSLLMNTLQSIRKKINKINLTVANILFCFLSRFSCLAKCRCFFRLISNSVVSCKCQPFPFLFIGKRHSNKHALTSVPERDIFYTKPSVYDSPGYLGFFSELLNRNARQITADKIVNITRNVYSGHVYNLQTKDGYYIAHNKNNGNRFIVVHNCRCSERFEIEGLSPTLRRSREQGVIPYQTYQDWEAEYGPAVSRR